MPGIPQPLAFASLILALWFLESTWGHTAKRVGLRLWYSSKPPGQGLEAGLISLKVRIVTPKFPPMFVAQQETVQQREIATRTQRECPNSKCRYYDCPHKGQHDYVFDCVRDRHSDCPSCKIVSKKIEKEEGPAIW